jgi:hypothetical protein
MRRRVMACAALAAALAGAAPAGRVAGIKAASAAELAPAVASRTVVVRKARSACECVRAWPHREYWRWDHRPVWDDPSAVLRPNFWGSPEPYLVPADVWARKWHLPRHDRWAWHRHERLERP